MKKIVGWNLAILGSALFVCELIFGSWLTGGGLGFVHVPRDLTLQHDTKNIRPGGGIIRYSRDKWGLRGDHKNPSEIKILTIGGSTTDELYSDDAETWSARLQHKFMQAGIPAVVGNAGINGHSTVGHLYSMEFWFNRIPQLEPKIILFYVGINDAVLPALAAQDAIVASGVWFRLRRYIVNNSAVVRLVRLIRGFIMAKRLRVAYDAAPPKLRRLGGSSKFDGTPYREAVSAYGDRINRLAELSKRKGALPIFISQLRGDASLRGGVMYATGGKTVKDFHALNLYNRKLLGTCQTLKAVCVDLAGGIKLSEVDFFDRLHTTPSGSARLQSFCSQVSKASCKSNYYMGRRSRILAPPSGESSIVRSPPWARITSRAIVSPSPLPAVSGLRALSSR